MARSELVSAVEISKRYDVHPETLRRLYRSGRVPAYKVGRMLRFDESEVREALRSTPSAAKRSTVRTEPDFDAIDAS